MPLDSASIQAGYVERSWSIDVDKLSESIGELLRCEIETGINAWYDGATIESWLVESLVIRLANGQRFQVSVRELNPIRGVWQGGA